MVYMSVSFIISLSSLFTFFGFCLLHFEQIVPNLNQISCFTSDVGLYGYHIILPLLFFMIFYITLTCNLIRTVYGSN